MNERASQVGVSQRLRVEWLEATANLMLAGNDVAAIRDALDDMLANKLSIGSSSERGSRQKTVTILMKIWRNVPPDVEPLRNDALQMLPALNLNHRHAVHWGMTLAVYPFWGMVAAHTGGLLRLQGTAAAAQVQRRIREQYGERQTVSRAAARVLRSFIDWDVLAEADGKGVYARRKQRELGDARVAAWLAEAMLRSQPRVGGSASLLRHPTLFPYRLPQLAASQLAAHSCRLDVLRQGLDQESLMLRRK